MANPIYYLLALAAVSLYPMGIEPLFFVRSEYRYLHVFGTALPTAIVSAVGIVVLFALTISALFWLTLRSSADDAVKRFRLLRLKSINRTALFVLYAALIFVFHFPLAVEEDFGISEPAILYLAVVFAPFLALAALNELVAGLFERRLHQEAPHWLRGALRFRFRAVMAFALMPLAILLAFLEVLDKIPSLERFSALYPFLGWVLGFGSIFLLLVVIPFLLKLGLGAKPLPEGALRERLSALCRKADFSCQDLLVFSTCGAKIGNAFITGLFSSARYVFFTDYILEALSDEEVEAVFAHEIAHSKKRHLWLFLFFSLAFMVAVSLLQQAVGDSALAGPMVLGLMLFFWLGLFSVFSRWCETEADIFGAALIGDPARFAQTLGRVAAINRISPQIGSLRHFSIARRVFLVHAFSALPLLGEKFRHRMKRLGQFVAVLSIVSVSYLAMEGIKQIRHSEAQENRWKARQSAAEGRKLLQAPVPDYARAEERFQKALESDDGNAELYYWLGVIQEAKGQRSSAAENYREALTRGNLRDPLLRLHAQEFLKQTHKFR